MKIYIPSPGAYQQSAGPLFEFRAVVVHKPSTRGGRYLLTRFRVSPDRADLLAEIAGLGNGEVA
jgi:hypothetical protein